ncbi:MAG TPA: BREX-1 system phosphatase PglZ type B [Chloroflexi bacterium]|nr:BREX-1 system phosphatase PglZ type B [Chloroflexota bacterium]
MQDTELTTFLDAIVQALHRAGLYNSNDQVAPVAVLWPDKERQWLPLLPALRARLPLLTLGDHDPAQRCGSAYWMRCMLARTLPDDCLPADSAPVLYLPGVSRQELRAVEECPRLLQPLADLQYRGVLWTQKNGRDWTVAAFLQSKEGGLEIPVGADAATKDALLRALPVLANTPLAKLRQAAPLRAPFLDALLHPDPARRLLLWLNDAAAYRQTLDAAGWQAFCNLCRRDYAFDPATTDPVTAARALSQPAGPWAEVWQRYTEAPAAYPNLAGLLRQARPPAQLALFEPPQPYWPQDNESAETALRRDLAALDNALPGVARARVLELEAHHGARREWVWSQQGLAPLAHALAALVTLTHATQQPLTGADAAAVARAYTATGWQSDAAVLAALHAVHSAEDLAAVTAAIRALYRPWLEQGARALQTLAAAQPGALQSPDLPAPTAGTCLLFVDALRFDVARRLADRLTAQGLTTALDWRFAALPPVTPTAKPAVSPVAQRLTGAGQKDFAPKIFDGGSVVNVAVLRSLLTDAGYQVLAANELGDPAGRAWTEAGAFDRYGHEHGWKLAHRIDEELLLIEERVRSLLARGWRSVRIVTDHGWLLLSGGLPKSELPIHASHVRKGRCALLKPGVVVDQCVVPWRWHAATLVATAAGIGCFEAGKEYEHGGISAQEIVTPVLDICR